MEGKIKGKKFYKNVWRKRKYFKKSGRKILWTKISWSKNFGRKNREEKILEKALVEKRKKTLAAPTYLPLPPGELAASRSRDVIVAGREQLAEDLSSSRRSRAVHGGSNRAHCAGREQLTGDLAYFPGGEELHHYCGPQPLSTGSRRVYRKK